MVIKFYGFALGFQYGFFKSIGFGYSLLTCVFKCFGFGSGKRSSSNMKKLFVGSLSKNRLNRFRSLVLKHFFFPKTTFL